MSSVLVSFSILRAEVRKILPDWENAQHSTHPLPNSLVNYLKSFLKNYYIPIKTHLRAPYYRPLHGLPLQVPLPLGVFLFYLHLASAVAALFPFITLCHQWLWIQLLSPSAGHQVTSNRSQELGPNTHRGKTHCPD